MHLYRFKHTRSSPPVKRKLTDLQHLRQPWNESGLENIYVRVFFKLSFVFVLPSANVRLSDRPSHSHKCVSMFGEGNLNNAGIV